MEYYIISIAHPPYYGVLVWLNIIVLDIYIVMYEQVHNFGQSLVFHAWIDTLFMLFA
jgi:hypothetical protein